ncbi:hypothetical protein NDU88_001787, partial [Pleurodeles waltl]
VVVECIKWAKASKLDVEEAVNLMLWFYRTTPHSVTKIYPFELLKGRRSTSRLFPA